MFSDYTDGAQHLDTLAMGGQSSSWLRDDGLFKSSDIWRKF